MHVVYFFNGYKSKCSSFFYFGQKNEKSILVEHMNKSKDPFSQWQKSYSSTE
jgi:hypothetical protein